MRVRRHPCPRVCRAFFIAACLVGGSFGAARAQSVEDLKQLSIEDLAGIEITSVSKRPEPLSDAAAAVYVITHDDIMRSGAVTIPEMLRLAPNLEVAQLNATTYAITARGFNVGNNAAMSDKLLVLIDGRTVYTPLFAGVYWDMQSVPPDDIERIEVISGPAGTLYGANAVNGVINIITRNSAETQGGLVVGGGGTQMAGGMVQYGGQANPLGDGKLTYRVYGEGWRFNSNVTSTGASAGDAWSRPQGGFRMDWQRGSDQVMLEGDDFAAYEDPSNRVGGHYIVGSWRRALDALSSLQVEAYYDQATRYTDNGGGGFTVDTYDVTAQHSVQIGGWNELVWGGDERVIAYSIENTATLLFEPADRTLDYASIFAQDTATLTPRLKLTVGMKLEVDPYVGLEPLPQLRLSWKPVDNMLLWSAVSRAVRSPTPVDRDLIERIGTTNILDGSFDFQSETLIAYELGTRVQVTPAASFSLSSYYNDYDSLRTLQGTAGGPLFPGLPFGLPLRWGNEMRGHVYGIEAWGDYRVTDWWRLSAGFNIQHEAFFYDSTATIGGTTFTADDPNHQASLHSYMDFGGGWSWDLFPRYVGKLHDPALPEYVELNSRIAWKINPRWEISLAGFNLIHAHHQEFVEPGISNEIPRSVLLESRWRF
ncbi:MAG TPA: TonB-dependent receptor [Stellaceae bacterium]|nr:TonB-dependent receptor [Stellaceae bacterium]